MIKSRKSTVISVKNCIGVNLPELLTVAKNDIHVLVKSLELANEGAGILGGGKIITCWQMYLFHQGKFKPQFVPIPGE